MQIQVGFYRAVVAPLFEEWHRLVNSPLSTAMLHHFVSNQARFYKTSTTNTLRLFTSSFCRIRVASWPKK